jgi:FHA domain
MAQRGDQALIGLDLNSSRVRALAGPPGRAPERLPLDAGHEELPLALSLQGRYPEVGRPGLALCRRSPHLVCLGFLAHLDTPRLWATERHRLDAGQALALVLGRLQLASHGSPGLVLAVPAYLTPGQVQSLVTAARKARLPVLGSVSAPLASALAAYAERAWQGTAVVADVDDHALTLMTLRTTGGQVQLLDARILPHLNLRAWKERLLTAAADRCIRQSRRDPRDCAAAEQTLYEKLEGVLDDCRQGRTVELVVETSQWYQNLIFPPEEIVQCCAALTRPVVDALEAICMATKPNEVPRVVFLTATAGRLPGLAVALQECLHDLTPREGPESPEEAAGGSPREDAPEPPRVVVLAPDAAARAAHGLAARFLRQELPAGHLDLRAPLPPQPVDAGPARLHFDGQDFPLRRATFTLGRQLTCDLVFDSSAYPTVSGWHCEIVNENRRYVLRDRSRHGTLVNNRPVDRQVTLAPGDWIRLGPDGPVLRFLGQAADPRKLITA